MLSSSVQKQHCVGFVRSLLFKLSNVANLLCERSHKRVEFFCATMMFQITGI
jgi:hypothetical protein